MTLNSFLLLLLTLFSNCKAVSISEVEKKIIPPGQRGQEIVIQYSATLTVAEPLYINSILLNDSDKKLEITLYKLPQGILFSPERKLDVGSYYIKANSIYKNEFARTVDTIKFNITDENDNVYLLKKEVILAKKGR